VKADMEERYGSKKGKGVFYASINKGKPGSQKWHRMKKRANQRAAGRRGGR